MTSTNKKYCFFVLILSIFVLNNCSKKDQFYIDVTVIGDGTGAVAAAVQSARSGANTMLVKTQPWLGGMLTSAGVSAVDGNHELPSGIWGEFRDSIYARYGGPANVATGWVSNTHFEPHVGNEIFQNMVKEENRLKFLDFMYVEKIMSANNGWKILLRDKDDELLSIFTKVLIDGTDLGDIAALAGVSYDLGMEDKESVDELIGSEKNGIIQDLTYVAILEVSKDEFGEPVPPSINYDPQIFHCACEQFCKDVDEQPHPCDVMMNYAKLPNDKYLINWPLHGNDIYLDIVNYNETKRQEALVSAKTKTLDFVHFIQTELGYKSLELSINEFPTKDLLPLMPYHREGRRIKGKVRFSTKHIKTPDEYNLYRTGIAVGNYPIDHHHKERNDVPDLNFPAVPSYALPIGSLIPNQVDNFLIADKAISVSNIANGTTRLQPVILQIGQVAGLIAATAVIKNHSVHKVNVRAIQKSILENGGYISPFKDLEKGTTLFSAAQRIAVCGLIDLEEKPYQWANETLLHPDSLMRYNEVAGYLNKYFDQNIIEEKDSWINVEQLIDLINSYQEISPSKISIIQDCVKYFNGITIDKQSIVNRKIYIYLVDKYLDPFSTRNVNLQGEWDRS